MWALVCGIRCAKTSLNVLLGRVNFLNTLPGGAARLTPSHSLPLLPSSLYFYCNRPTVAAIIAMGVDVGAAASAAFGGSEEAVGAAAGAGHAAAGDGKAAEAAGEGGEGQQEGCQVEGEPAAVGQAGAIAQGVQPTEERVEQARRAVWCARGDGCASRLAGHMLGLKTAYPGLLAMLLHAAACCVANTLALPPSIPAMPQVQLMRSGSSASAAGDRSTFRLSASLGTLQVRLNYEGAGCATLSQVIAAQHGQHSMNSTACSVQPALYAAAHALNVSPALCAVGLCNPSFYIMTHVVPPQPFTGLGGCLHLWAGCEARL